MHTYIDVFLLRCRYLFAVLQLQLLQLHSTSFQPLIYIPQHILLLDDLLEQLFVLTHGCLRSAVRLLPLRFVPTLGGLRCLTVCSKCRCIVTIPVYLGFLQVAQLTTAQILHELIGPLCNHLTEFGSFELTGN